MKENNIKNLTVVILSDLNWELQLKHLTNIEVDQFNEENLKLLRFERIRRYFDIIMNEKADLVLFSGDLTGDGFCGQGFQNAFLDVTDLSLNQIHHLPITASYKISESMIEDYLGDVID